MAINVPIPDVVMAINFHVVSIQADSGINVDIREQDRNVWTNGLVVKVNGMVKVYSVVDDTCIGVFLNVTIVIQEVFGRNVDFEGIVALGLSDSSYIHGSLKKDCACSVIVYDLCYSNISDLSKKVRIDNKKECWYNIK